MNKELQTLFEQNIKLQHETLCIFIKNGQHDHANDVRRQIKTNNELYNGQTEKKYTKDNTGNEGWGDIIL